MKIKTSSFQEWKALSSFYFPFKGHICYCKRLEVTRRSVEAMKKENIFTHSKKEKQSVKKIFCPFFQILTTKPQFLYDSLLLYMNDQV